MSYFYKKPKNIFSYVTFFIYVYITSFILFVIGRLITEVIIVGLFLGDVTKILNFFSSNLTQEYLIDFFLPFILGIPIIIIGGVIANVLNLGSLGAKMMTGIYIRLASGKIGNFIGLIPLFDFGGTWIVETKAKDEVNLSTGRGMYKELVLERGNDVLFFSSLVAAFLLILLGRLGFVSLSPANFLFNNLINEADFYAIIAGFITIFVLCLYFPSMWIFRDGEIKKIAIDEEGDVKSVKNVSNTYRQGLSLFIGFSSLIGIGNVALNWIDLQVMENNISSIPVFIKYVGVYVYAIGFFLILASIMIPGISLATIRYMKHHEENILKTRHSLLKRGTGKSGSIQFSESSILSDIESSLDDIRNQLKK